MKRFITIVSLILYAGAACAQGDVALKNAYRIENNNIVLYLDPAWTRAQQEKLLDNSGMATLSLDTLWKFGSIGRLAKEGWKMSPYRKSGYKIYKGIDQLSGNVKWNKEVMVFTDLWHEIQRQTTATFGVNNFKKQTVRKLSTGTTRFFLAGKRDAADVYLSGTFNNWSTLRTPMAKTDSGWVADITLKPGKHCYKFIVNGRWMEDPENIMKEDDFHGGYNSVYFVSNYEFKLSGYAQAREVVLSGTFNNWNRQRLRMQKVNGVWRLPVYLNDGTHEYKFLVDGKWITDPANPNVRDDGHGNKNSYLQLGEPATFTLNGYTTARQVVVSGTFNGWNELQLKMTRNTSGWQLQHGLAPGNYQYKYIVDGQWILDPANPHTGNLAGHENSLMAVKANHTFMLKGYPNAKEVHLAGNFNDWTGYTMKKVNGGWAIDVYLPPGKCLYKFVVDETWIIDPANQLWEQNEHGTGNSVLWVGQE